MHSNALHEMIRGCIRSATRPTSGATINPTSGIGPIAKAAVSGE